MTDVQDEVEDEVDEEVADEVDEEQGGTFAMSAQEPGEPDLGHEVQGHEEGNGGVSWVRASDLSQPSRKDRDAWIVRVGQRLCGGGRGN